MKRITALILSVLLTAAMAMPAFARYTTDDTYTLGDADASGTVNARDQYVVAAHTAGIPCDFPAPEAADLNADGTANARDVLYYKAALAGLRDLSSLEGNFPVYSAKIGGRPLEDFCVTVPDGIDPEGKDFSVQNAAQLFRNVLSDAVGPWLDLCNESSASSDALISFHVVGEGETADGHSFGVEDYYYKVTDARLDIYGSEYRGNLYAVYEILEKYFGVYWYSCSDTRLIKHRLAELETGLEVYHQSAFSFRFAVENFYNPGTRQGALDYYFPRRLNGTQMGAYTGDYYGSLTGPHGYNAHSFQEYYCMYNGSWPETPNADPYYDYQYKHDSYPDPNAANHWQPCASDDTVYSELFGGLLLTMEQWVIPPHGNHVFRNEAGLSAMSFSICDNADFCTCTTCAAKANGSTMNVRKATLQQLESYSGEYTLSEDGKKVTFGKESFSGIYLDLGNRAARDIQEYYPGMKIYMIIYDHTVPESVRPDENLVLMYCGCGCSNHYINSGECGDSVTCLGGNNTETVETLNAWTKMCHDAGAEIWFWYYPITNGYYLNGCPNILNIYYDFTYLADIGVDGIYYEGGDQEYNFETLKAFLAAKVMWDPDMTIEEYTEIMKEYLRIYYGNGYEEIYRYILLDDESGNANGCFINNHDRPFDMHSKEYLSAHYEEMHSLLAEALGKCVTAEQTERLTLLYYCAEFMGLSASYERMYENGDAASRALYEERYTDMWTYMYGRDLMIFHTPALYSVPDELDFTTDPMTQFYGFGSWNGWDR